MTKEEEFYLPQLSEEELRQKRADIEAGRLPEKIDRSSDLFFRFLLGVPSRSELLIDLLNSLFGTLNYPKVQSVELAQTEIPPSKKGGKHTRLDIRALDETKRKLLIELQKMKEEFFVSRSLYYLAKLFLEHLHEGEDYGKLTPVLFVGLLGFDLFEGKSRSVWDFVWTNPETGLHLPGKREMQTMFFVEMNKISRNGEGLRRRLGTPGYVMTDAERLLVWSSYMSNNILGVELVETVLVKDKVFGQVREAEKSYWSSPDNRWLQEKWDMDERAYDANLRRARDDGRNEERQIFLNRLLADGIPYERAARLAGLTN